MRRKKHRDAQRQKLYNAEGQYRVEMRGSGSSPARKYKTRLQVVRRMEAIVNSKWWADNVQPGCAIRVSFTSRMGACYVPQSRFTAPTVGRFRIGNSRMFWNDLLIVHELAHFAIDHIYGALNVQDHGREYCRLYLAMIQRFMGKAHRDKMRDAFKAHKVKYVKPPKLSAERRAQLREQGKRLAAKSTDRKAA